MDKDFGDIFYVLMVVLAGVISVAKSVKAKKQKAEAQKRKRPTSPTIDVPQGSEEAFPTFPTHDESWPTTNWDDHSDNRSYSVDVEQEKRLATLATEPVEMKMNTGDEGGLLIPVNKNKRVRKEHERQTQEANLHLADDVEENEMGEDFSFYSKDDARRAMIYSEILNRKY